MDWGWLVTNAVKMLSIIEDKVVIMTFPTHSLSLSKQTWVNVLCMAILVSLPLYSTTLEYFTEVTGCCMSSKSQFGLESEWTIQMCN